MSPNKKASPLQKSDKPSELAGTRLTYLLLAGVFLGGVIIVATVIVWGFPNFFATSQATITPSGLDTNTAAEILIARREKEEAQLNSYGWLDKESGLVRIPITRAMALIIERGLPVGSEGPEEIAPTEERPASTPTLAADRATEPPSGETPAPEPAPTVLSTPTVDLSQVSFKEHVLPILEQHCFKCHGGEKPEGGLRIEEGLSLTTYEDIMAGSWNGSVIEPGEIEDSYLIDQISTGRMPKEGPRVPPDQIKIISAWVEAGALDN